MHQLGIGMEWCLLGICGTRNLAIFKIGTIWACLQDFIRTCRPYYRIRSLLHRPQLALHSPVEVGKGCGNTGSVHPSWMRCIKVEMGIFLGPYLGEDLFHAFCLSIHFCPIINPSLFSKSRDSPCVNIPADVTVMIRAL